VHAQDLVALRLACRQCNHLGKARGLHVGAVVVDDPPGRVRAAAPLHDVELDAEDALCALVGEHDGTGEVVGDQPLGHRVESGLRPGPEPLTLLPGQRQHEPVRGYLGEHAQHLEVVLVEGVRPRRDRRNQADRYVLVDEGNHDGGARVRTPVEVGVGSGVVPPVAAQLRLLGRDRQPA